MKKVILLNSLFLIVFTGCYKSEPVLAESIFKQVKEVERPEIKSLEDIQKSYIFLFEAYESNLNLLRLIENSSKNF